MNRQVAVALKYRMQKDPAPRVVAKGWGAAAEEILDLAREFGVPVRKDSGMAEVLSRLDLGTAIPPELYPVIAETLAYVYRMNRKVGGQGRG